ncbi:hypothetical protein NDU88_006099 [Pleurodeles waltl]|uniref:Uncharacterized protein n=1 Tax=Pleurodeles waltl TaxID=8319 RepID=A0AAV7QJV2_PLEWA|nr:hypothetical protein NDU88_006099 [Pleurodeles waltl]
MKRGRLAILKKAQLSVYLLLQDCPRPCTTGIGAGRHWSSRTWRNRRLQKPPRPEQKQPLRGGAERCSNRNQREPLRTAADPGKLIGKAATLQEKRGLSSTTGIGAGRHWSSRTWRNRRLQKPPRPEQKQPVHGGAERRSNRNQREPLRTAAEPGKLIGKAATLQEKRGLSRSWEKEKKKRTRETRLKEKSPPPTRTEQSSVAVACILLINPINQIY